MIKFKKLKTSTIYIKKNVFNFPHKNWPQNTLLNILQKSSFRKFVIMLILFLNKILNIIAKLSKQHFHITWLYQLNNKITKLKICPLKCSS